MQQPYKKITLNISLTIFLMFFSLAAVSENVYAGTAMNHRAIYMYGNILPADPHGQIDCGRGKNPSTGNVTLIAPNDIIKTTGEKRTIDGVEIVFQMAPDTEAPSEMLIYFPQFKMLCSTEDATHTLHNLYTLRDANKWWKTLDEAIDLFGGDVEIILAQHHWPRWGNADINLFLANQRNDYKFLHDQTLRLANMGYTPRKSAKPSSFLKL